MTLAQFPKYPWGWGVLTLLHEHHQTSFPNILGAGSNQMFRPFRRLLILLPAQPAWATPLKAHQIPCPMLHWPPRLTSSYAAAPARYCQPPGGSFIRITTLSGVHWHDDDFKFQFGFVWLQHYWLGWAIHL